MPKATVNSEDVFRYELKSAPPDGFVVLKRLSYGQVLERRSMMKLEVATKGGKTKGLEGELALADRAYTQFDFRNCIVEHNLENESGGLLNLGNPNDLVRLDPKIGQEIENLLSELNDLEEKDEEDLASGSGQ